MRILKRLLLAALLLCALPASANAAEIAVACAANFTPAMKELVAKYETETGVKVVPTFGSTGMLYGQITHKAPYDLFFAADEKRPALLHEAGLSAAPRLYARGRVVLWSKRPDAASMNNWEDVVELPAVTKIGIASPKTAPYGLRAEQAMKKTGLYSEIEPKLAFGKNVGMAFQYAYSGAAGASFVALSQALSGKGAEGKYWMVSEAGPVGQAACVLNSPKAKEAAQFLDWLTTPAAAEIIGKYGYELP